MNMNQKKQGISLISLIITIIVIIILAAIVIFSGLDSPNKAQLSKVINDIDNVQTAVDQAYYGLYTEKSVAGEVWTKSQLYESVATGEKNRENLKGEGIVDISEDSLVDMNLPKYEGRKWGVAVEDLSPTIQVGSAVLMPGFESQGKIYSTLLDLQGAQLQPSSEDDSSGEKAKILAKINVGDFVNYTPNEGSATMLYTNRIYDATSSEQIRVTSKKTNWRILDIDEETCDILLTTDVAPILYDESESDIGGVHLKGSLGYVNGAKELDRICKELYSNYAKGIYARNMSIEDLNKITGFDPKSVSSNYGRLYTYSDGKFYTYEENGKTVTVMSPKEATEENEVTIKHTYFENELTGKVNEVLENGWTWLASPCVNIGSEYIGFDMHVLVSGQITAYDLCDSFGVSRDSSFDVRPVISINGRNLNIDDESKNGQTAETAWNIK